MVRILFLDRDGTLNRSLNGRSPNNPARVELLPNVDATLAVYADEGWRLVIVTNQGGVAFGYLSEDEAWAVHQAVLDRLSVPVDASYLCPHHPRGNVSPYNIDCPRRKPNPGAILEALARFGARSQDCLFVGDRESDRQAAAAARVPFQWAHDFFGWRSGPA
jgi:D-glycero-D-manno-heptose 1,7-bisphosphate phosphatase